MTRAEKLLLWAACFAGVAFLLMMFSAPLWVAVVFIGLCWGFLIKAVFVSKKRSNRVH